MRASTLLLVTWLIWIAAKGRLSAYWALASTASAAAAGSSAPGGDSDHAASSPGFDFDMFSNNPLTWNPLADGGGGDGW